jgi:hypothetical protein
MLRKQYQLDSGAATITISETRDKHHVCLTVAGLSPEPVTLQLNYQEFSALCETRFRLELEERTPEPPNLAIAA